MRRCKVCGQEKPLDRYHFKPHSGGRGYSYKCRECMAARQRERYAAKRAREISALPPIELPTKRRCGKCGETKPLTPEFWPRQASAKMGLSYRCKECRNAEARARYTADPQAAQARSRAWRIAKASTPEGREELARKNRETYRRSKERDLEAHRALARAQQERYNARLRADPKRLKAKRESNRIATRLRAERKGRQVPPVSKAPRDATFPVIPAAPMVEMIEQRIAVRVKALNGDTVNLNVKPAACSDLGIAERQFRAWQSGEIKALDIDTADRILLNANLHWWDVFDPVRWPEAAAIAEKAFEPELS